MEIFRCQSCGLPISEETKGTNRDQSKNEEYCRECFQDGKFTNQSLSLHELEMQLLEKAEMHNEMTVEEAEQLRKIIPSLKRWRMNNI